MGSIPTHIPASAPTPTPARGGRLDQPGRVPGVDLARGLAVTGMFAAHLLTVPDVVWGRPSSWLGLVRGHSSILFALLAGVSLTLAGPGRERRGTSGPHGRRSSLAARGLVLWALGLALLLLDLPVVVILPAYGLLFVVAAGLVRFSTRALVGVAATLALTMPLAVAAVDDLLWPPSPGPSDWLRQLAGWHYPFVLWAAFLAAGMASGRLLRTDRRCGGMLMLGVGAALAVVGHGLLGPLGNGAASQNPAPATSTWLLATLTDAPHSSGMGETVGSGGLALAVAGGCVLLAGPGSWAARLLWPLRALGAMPLTAYVSHLVAWGLWLAVERRSHPNLDPLADFRALDPFWPTTGAVLIGCALWTVLAGRGPLERLVAAATSGLVHIVARARGHH